MQRFGIPYVSFIFPMSYHSHFRCPTYMHMCVGYIYICVLVLLFQKTRLRLEGYVWCAGSQNPLCIIHICDVLHIYIHL